MPILLHIYLPIFEPQYSLPEIWQRDTLYSLAKRHARDRPSTCALRDVDVRLNWREVLERAESIAEELHAPLKRG